MAVQNQSLTLWRLEDRRLVFAGPSGIDPSAWDLKFTVRRSNEDTPVFTETSPTIEGAGPWDIVVDLPPTIPRGDYLFDLYRTDPGSGRRLAGGTIVIQASARVS